MWGRAVERFGSGMDEVSCGKFAGVEDDRFGSVAATALSIGLDVCCGAFGESVLPLRCELVVVGLVPVAVAGGACDVAVPVKNNTRIASSSHDAFRRLRWPVGSRRCRNIILQPRIVCPPQTPNAGDVVWRRRLRWLNRLAF